jgi:hypothetical protein
VGATFLLVFVASILSERLLSSAMGSGGVSDRLVTISDNLTRMRISNLVAVVDSLVSIPDFDQPIVMDITGLPYLPFEPVLVCGC